MRVLLVTPPIVQLNGPYPATAYLTHFLKSKGVDVRQADASLELSLRLFSPAGLLDIAEAVKSAPLSAETPGSSYFLANFDQFHSTIAPVINFLQGRDPTLAYRIVTQRFLPEDPEYLINEYFSKSPDDPLSGTFGTHGIQDRAKYMCGQYLGFLAAVIRESIDPLFELAAYGERLTFSMPTFKPLQRALDRKLNLIDHYLQRITVELLELHEPDVMGWSVPFPGNVYAAFRMAAQARQSKTTLVNVMGGGYVNTELRSLKEPRVFDYFDYVTLDDGEMPLLCLLEHLQGKRAKKNLVRVFLRENGEVRYFNDPTVPELKHKDSGMPLYEGLSLNSYVSILTDLLAGSRIYWDGRWNHLTLAHGCYWKRCKFCDITLDYINRYDPASADLLVDRMEAISRETGTSGFHFVDEAGPPALLRKLSEQLLARKSSFTWWTNVRFDSAFTPELTDLMARAGCISVTGGLEVASDRILKQMDKGISLAQVTRVTRAFTEAGISVYAYLIYGYPGQTAQEIVDSLEVVRQLFAADCLRGGYWHRFMATAHSPIGKDPAKYGIRLVMEEEPTFADYAIPYEDLVGADPALFGSGLCRAVYNYGRGVGLESDIRMWFRHEVPATTVPPNFIEEAVNEASRTAVAGEAASLPCR